MGRHKKSEEEKHDEEVGKLAKEHAEEPKKKQVTKYRCHIGGQWKDFNSQQEAKKMAITILETDGVFYLTLSEVKVDDC